jgi:hypothetical protein
VEKPRALTTAPKFQAIKTTLESGTLASACFHFHTTPTPTYLPFVEALVRGEPGQVTGIEGRKTTALLESVLSAIVFTNN